ncbi:hypothetical protein Tco_1062530 [Tanacetum coccineum]
MKKRRPGKEIEYSKKYSTPKESFNDDSAQPSQDANTDQPFPHADTNQPSPAEAANLWKPKDHLKLSLLGTLI